MTRMPGGEQIEAWMIQEVAAGRDAEVAARAAKRFGITRQAVGRYLQKLVKNGHLVSKGQTKARRYQLAVLKKHSAKYPLGADFQEDQIWSKDLRPLLESLPENIQAICAYGATEMLNNARDHSGAKSVAVDLRLMVNEVSLAVSDEGIGIFRKIKEAYQLEDDRHAILELSKGRLTTDPEHHTGEGVFFTSRAFDSFTILSGSLALVHNREEEDWLIEHATAMEGTRVGMSIHPASKHTLQEIFDRYATEQDDYAFQRTHFLLKLAQAEGSTLISRSQAKRVMARGDRFREIVLDFTGITSIGPAFADEIFRVWRKAHPNVKLVPSGMNPEVEKMVRRALAPEVEPQEQKPSAGGS